MQPYSSFDIKNNPIIVIMDRHGICMVNMKTNDVFHIQDYDDQAQSKYSSQLQANSPKKEQEIQSFPSSEDLRTFEKQRFQNVDMWQKYNDCIICDQKSIPNAQGVLIQHSSRNMLIGFNKTLQVWRYEHYPYSLELGPKMNQDYNHKNHEV